MFNFVISAVIPPSAAILVEVLADSSAILICEDAPVRRAAAASASSEAA